MSGPQTPHGLFETPKLCSTEKDEGTHLRSPMRQSDKYLFVL